MFMPPLAVEYICSMYINVIKYTLGVLPNLKVWCKILFMIKYFPLVLTLFCQLSFGQAYDYFSSEKSRWFVRYSYPHANEQNPYFIETKTYVYGFQGDTSISGTLWKRLYQSRDSSFLSNLVHLGYFRSEQNLILFLDPSGIIDTIYNFNLEVGDSVLYKIGDSDSSFISILEIDSIQIDEQYHKRYHFERISRPLCCYLEEVWIEGIGSVFGPLSPIYPNLIDIEFSTSHGLTCFYNSELIWQNPNYTECYYQKILGIADNDKVFIKTFPNPFRSIITIQSYFPDEKEIFIVNLLGESIRSYQIWGEENTIDLSDMPCGVYFIRIVFDNKVFNSRIIKTY
ncbi:MAG TPA: T9SS type A sorting domain-containing protein [Candidatus Scalindua sp.]|nr:T9SS type A sorting domain-containing protein [Candidatus Scalindua sp.]